jgi:periplasmic protein TonB
MWPRGGLLCLLIAVAMPCRAETDAVAAWQKQIFIRLNASRSFPPQAMGQSGTAKVRFVLDRSGKLISNQILQSSGLKPFDLEAVAIVDRAQPFPAPPAEIDDDRLKLIVPMDFDGKAGMSPLDVRRAIEIGKEEARMRAMLRGICRGC